MSKIRLICSPETPPLKAEHVDVEIRTAGYGRLFARYVVECDTSILLLPEPREPVRSNHLWQTTCFELFVKRPDGERYLEYNFSPSSEWALYRFSDYRKGMAEEIAPRPRIICNYTDSHFALDAEFDLPDQWLEGEFMLGISAVVEESEGRKSYWALAHPPGQPDFHHKDCFALKLEAPSAA
jgi:hypothetical protein